jgi:hypothetical protein
MLLHAVMSAEVAVAAPADSTFKRKIKMGDVEEDGKATNRLVGLADEVRVVEGDEPVDSDAVGVPVPEVVAVPVVVVVGGAVALPDCVPVLVAEGDAPRVNEAVGDTLVVVEALTVDEGVADAVSVPDPVVVPVALLVGVCEGVADPLREVEPVLLADAPVEREAVGEALSVLLAEVVEEGVGAAVAVPVPVSDGVCVPVPVWLDVPLPFSDTEPVMLAEAPEVRDAVGDADTVVDALTVEVGVGAAVPVTVPVGEPVELPVGDGDGEAAALKLVLPVLLPDDPVEREALGDALTVLLAEVVEEGVEDDVAVPVPEGEGVCVHVPVWLGVPLPLSDTEPVLLADAPWVIEGVADAVPVRELVADGAPVNAGEEDEENGRVGVTVGLRVLLQEEPWM